MPNYNPYPYQYPQFNNYHMQPVLQNQQVQTPQLQIQNGGLVSVHNEDEARNYPIAIGTSITFKDENAPYVYTKTMGFSQLESPKFDKYRLVKEELPETHKESQSEVSNENSMLNTIDEIKSEIDALWKEINGIKNTSVGKSSATKKEKDGGDRHDG